MRNFKRISLVLRIATALAAVVLTIMMARAMKLLYVLMKREGIF